MNTDLISRFWCRFWMRYAGVSRLGKIFSRLAALGAAPYYGRIALANLSPKGYVSHKATIHHSFLNLGKNIFIGDRVVIYQDTNGGPVELGDGVHVHMGCVFQTGEGGSIKVGSLTHIQPRCQFSAYMSSIVIGSGVEIAPNCSFYPYDHRMELGKPIRNQPLQSKGGITIEDDVWLGVGVIVLDGVRIGKGAVVGAGSVVTKHLPENSISLGVPARVVKMRGGLN